MIRVSRTELKALNNDFYRFQSRITQSKKQNNGYYISQLKKYEKKYKKAGIERNFAECVFAFADKLSKSGVLDLPGITYSFLMKMPFVNLKTKEIYATKALEYADKQGDYIHTLARLVDLEKIYKQNKNSEKYAKMLERQEKVLIYICNNYKEIERNYKTCSRKLTPQKQYKTELAKTRVDIAKVILNENPVRASRLLKSARVEFLKENREKEVGFINKLLAVCARKESK